MLSGFCSVDWASYVLCFFYLFLVKYLNAHTGIVFLRFPKRCYRLLWSALPFITNVDTRGQKIPCFLNCLHVGGKKFINTHFIMNQIDLLTILNINWTLIKGICIFQEQLEHVRSFWSDTTRSSSIECSLNVKMKVRDLIECHLMLFILNSAITVNSGPFMYLFAHEFFF